MRQCEATEGDIRLRRGARIKKTTKQGSVLKSRARRLPVLECEGGGGCLFTRRMNTRMPTSTVVFFLLISNDIFREGVVCWQKIFLCLHISKFNKIIGPYY